MTDPLLKRTLADGRVMELWQYLFNWRITLYKLEDYPSLDDSW